MPTNYSQSGPNLIKDANGNVTQIDHSHYQSIDYQSYGKDKEGMNQQIAKEKAKLKGCMAFFKAVVDDKKIDGIVRASALSAYEEDKAILENHEDHKHSKCSIQ
jgi:hypothetical protein